VEAAALAEIAKQEGVDGDLRAVSCGECGRYLGRLAMRKGSKVLSDFKCGRCGHDNVLVAEDGRVTLLPAK